MIDRYIAYAALNSPYLPAIVTAHVTVTYERFDREIDLFADWLAERTDPAGASVVVCCADRYLHWLLILAAARLDLATASVTPLTAAAVVSSLKPQIVLSDVPLPGSSDDRGRFERLTADIAAGVLSAEPGQPRPSRVRDPDRLMRISSSSGTTGTPKLLAASARRVERRTSMMGFSAAGLRRLLLLVGPESGGFDSCLGVWAAAGTVIFPPASVGELAETLRVLDPSLLAGAPVQLQHLVAALPPGFIPIPGLLVGLFGAHAPMSLRTELAHKLSGNVFNAFGSTEAGLIAGAHLVHLTEPSMTGFIYPSAEVEIVDDAGAPMPAGELGHIRVRTPDMAREYLNDPQATQRFFKDGWFHPGDLGSLSADGMLRLEGRADEVINAGGEKLLPLHLESAALECAGVEDAAGFMAPGESGTESAWVAVKPCGDVDRAELARRFAALGAPAVNIAWVAEIPRNARGKIDREGLRERLLQMRGGTAAANRLEPRPASI